MKTLTLSALCESKTANDKSISTPLFDSIVEAINGKELLISTLTAYGRRMERELSHTRTEHLKLIMDHGELQKSVAPLKARIAELENIIRAKATLAATKAFTLIELLAVIAIIAIVFSALAPAVARAIHHARDRAQMISEYSNARLQYALEENFTNELFTVGALDPVGGQP